MTPDEILLDRLAKSGSDLSQLHQIDFTLRFPTQKAGERAELRLLEFAFKTTLTAGKSASEWIIHGIKVMYPVASDLEGLREKLDAIALAGKGSYDGWTAKLFIPKPAN